MVSYYIDESIDDLRYSLVGIHENDSIELLATVDKSEFPDPEDAKVELMERSPEDIKSEDIDWAW